MARTPDTAQHVAFDQTAPQLERTEALAELQKAHAPRSLSDMLLPPDQLREVYDYIQDSGFSEMAKAQVIQFPTKERKGSKGPSSVQLDDFQITLQGDYWEKPSAFGFDSMRQMVAQTPVLNAVIMTRIRQVQRFCRINESGEGPGFTVRHVEKDHQPTKSEKESIALLNKFLQNCGWEFNPRARKRMKRDSFPQLIGKMVRDSLTMDSAAIETEFKRDKAQGLDGLYAVDGATIRLCTEHGYQGDDEIFALQVIQGRICTAYTHDDLIYEPRNAQSDVLCAGYGLGETELMVRVVTGFLNAMTHNIKGLSDNAIPKGLLHLTGNYDDKDLMAFKRYWNGMVKGINNAWSLPVMISKDQESKASFENFGISFNEMYFGKWMTFLTSIICAIYGMSPAEINFDSFSGGNTSPLGGSDTSEKLAASKDSGLRPILSWLENTLSDFVISDFSDKYVLRFTGLDEEDAKVKEERSRLVLTVDEIRAQQNLGKHPDPKLGGAPVNPSLIGPWMQFQQAEQQPDFGQAPGGGDQGGDEAEGGKEQGSQPQDKGQPQEDAPPTAQGGAQPADPGEDEGQPQPLAKALDFGALPLASRLAPIYAIEA